MSLRKSYKICRQYAKEHYENFPENKKPELIAQLDLPQPCDVYLRKGY